MASSPPDGKVEVKVLAAKKLAKLGGNRTDDRFRVKLSLGDQTHETKTKSRGWITLYVGSKVSWNEHFQFTFVGQMPDLTLEISAQESEKDIFIGRTIVSYADLSSNGRPRIGIDDVHKLQFADDNEKLISELAISIKFISLGDVEPIDELNTADTLKDAALAVRRASDALDEMQRRQIPSLFAALGQGTAISEAAGPATAIGSIFKTIGTIADVMDELTMIHPYANAVWKILGFAWKVIKAQMIEDDNIRGLSEQMESLLHRIQTFVNRLDNISPSSANPDERQILRDVARTSHRCSEFIVDFCNDHIVNRAAKHALFGDASKRVAQFQSDFALLDRSFNEKVWDGTALGVRQILENQLADQVAKFMVLTASLLASTHRACHPETQVATRKTITDWIDRVDDVVPRVLLLSGMAGTGKSTIAYTIASERQGTNCISFAFNRRAQPPPMASMLFPHIAAFLATFYPAVKKALTEKKELASGVDLEQQLWKLVIEPLKLPRPNVPSPIVIMIDALDEADSDGEQAATLARLLATACDELPPNIRIFVTSRVERYVVKTMWPSAIQRLDMPELSDESLAEVRLFIKDKLEDVPDMDEIHYDNLMTTSQGLFQWAATACKEIGGAPVRGGSTPLQRYNTVAI